MSELTPATAALSGRQHANWQLLQRASDFISRTVLQQPALQAVLTEDSHLQQMLHSLFYFMLQLRPVLTPQRCK